MYRKILNYLINVAIGLDQLLNTVLGGDPDETLSSRIAKRRTKPGWRVLAGLLETIDPGHLDRYVEWDEGRHAIWNTKFVGETENVAYGSYDSALRAWNYLCRQRDKETCRMCNREKDPLEVHHIKPKSLFPEHAYDLNNGVTLCFICHRGIVHAGNTFELTNWEKFVPMLSRFSVEELKFNEKNQPTIDAKVKTKGVEK